MALLASLPINENTERPSADVSEAFWLREASEALARNVSLAYDFKVKQEEYRLRRSSRLTIVLGCMDNRNAYLEEALGLLPGQVQFYASGGGKISIENFDKLFGNSIEAEHLAGHMVTVFMVPHESSSGKCFGCAAFASDTEAQREFFLTLTEQLSSKFVNLYVHVLFFDTATHRLRPFCVDEADAILRRTLIQNKAFAHAVSDVAREGFGIYLGDTYRAWVRTRNRYFRLSTLNPSLKSNIEIAISLFEAGSIDLNFAPIIIHVDYPLFEDGTLNLEARNNINNALTELLSDDGIRDRIDAGLLRFIKTETKVDTWEGKLLEPIA